MTGVQTCALPICNDSKDAKDLAVQNETEKAVVNFFSPMEKAHHLKDFVTALFEWVKLDAGEQIFHFEVCDLNELSRDIMADWVPLLENHDLSYEIEIPETEYMTRVDSTAYTRILNNLLQNILTHSDASKVFLTVTETEQQAKIVVADNGNGIAASDLPHIFERM